MSWVTVIWSMGGSAIYGVVWWNDRMARANVLFAVMALAVAMFSVFELMTMRAETSEQFGMAVRWMYLPAWVLIASLVAFVRLHLRAGRRRLAWVIVSVRTLSLILNFKFPPNLNPGR